MLVGFQPRLFHLRVDVIIDFGLYSAMEQSLLCLTALTSMKTQFQSKDHPFVSVLTKCKDYTHDLSHLQ